MPDYGFIAQPQVQNPANTLGSMMDIAGKAQQLQTSRQAYQAGNIDLQKAQQANDERLRLQQFMANPDNFQTNGRIDLDKANAAIPKIAPYTGGEVLQKLSVLSNAQTTALSAKQNLTQTQRSMIANTMSILGRAKITDPAIYDNELQNLKTTNPDNPELHKLIDSYSTVLKLTPAGPHLADVAIRASQSLMGPAEQQSSFAPQMGLTSTGGKLEQTTTQPPVGGAPGSVTVGQNAPGAGVPLTIAPGALETIEEGPDRNKYIVQRSSQGTIVGTRSLGGGGQGTGQPGVGGQPAGGGTGMPSFPVGQTEAMRLNAATAADDWKQTFAAGQKASQNIGVLQEIKKYAPGAVSGVGQDRRAFLAGLAGLIGMDAAQMEKTDTDLLAKNTNMLALAGGDTNLSKTLSEVANPNVHMTKEAIIKAANQVIAQQQLPLVRAKHLGKVANDPAAYTQAATEFNANADPRVLQYPTMTPAERAEMKKAMNPQEQLEFGNKLRFFQHFGHIK
jgi:hypothetical protein